ncbi:MAG: hypothetical protein Q8P64_13995, partial [Deltaproteobacteria bacterium]|nr:hypothetical protein [Deltaproteobacteria bacterium]
ILNPKPRSRNKFGMTKRPEPNPLVMLNLFQHLVGFFLLSADASFIPAPAYRRQAQKGVFRCDFNKFQLPDNQKISYRLEFGYWVLSGNWPACA